jgi:hypothetical protein
MKTMRMPLAALMLALVSIASAQYHTPGTKTVRSPSGRYAIQERNGRPWLLDTTKGTAQLLADDTAGRQLVALGFPSYDAQPLQVLISAISHEPLKSAVKWHPTKDIVALDVVLELPATQDTEGLVASFLRICAQMEQWFPVRRRLCLIKNRVRRGGAAVRS